MTTFPWIPRRYWDPDLTGIQPPPKLISFNTIIEIATTDIGELSEMSERNIYAGLKVGELNWGTGTGECSECSQITHFRVKNHPTIYDADGWIPRWIWDPQNQGRSPHPLLIESPTENIDIVFENGNIKRNNPTHSFFWGDAQEYTVYKIRLRRHLNETITPFPGGMVVDDTLGEDAIRLDGEVVYLDETPLPGENTLRVREEVERRFHAEGNTDIPNMEDVFNFNPSSNVKSITLEILTEALNGDQESMPQTFEKIYKILKNHLELQ